MVKFYKKISKILPWKQPVFTSASDNGTLGGDKFACYAHLPQSDLAGQDWYLFRANLGSGYSQGSAVNYPNGYWLLYNPNLLNITNLSLYNIPYYAAAYNDAAMKTGNVYGSMDNQNWELLTSFTNTNYGAGGNYQVDLSDNTKYYRYYKIQATSQGVVANPSIDYINGLGLIKVTATQKIEKWQECTQAEYDQLSEDDKKIVTDIYSIFSVDKFYKLADVEKDYIQPTATLGLDSGALGVIGGQNLDSVTDRTNEAPNAFNGGTATFDKYTSGGVPVFYWIFRINNPSNVTLRSITFTCNSGYMQGSNDGSTWVNLDNGSFASGRKTINITQQFTYYRINVNYVNRYGTNYGIYHDVSLSDVILTGTYITQAWQECTKSEYDKLADNLRKQKQGLYAPKLNNKAYLGGVDRELKKITIVKSWKQPVFTSASDNGTLGGDKFAFDAYLFDPYLGQATWRIMSNPNSVGNYEDCGRVSWGGYWTIYNPNALNITSLKVMNMNHSVTYRNCPIGGVNILGSKDGINYTLLKSYTNTNGTGGAWWTIDMSNNTNYYKYYRIQHTTKSLAGDGSTSVGIARLIITATQKIVTIVRK